MLLSLHPVSSEFILHKWDLKTVIWGGERGRVAFGGRERSE